MEKGPCVDSISVRSQITIVVAAALKMSSGTRLHRWVNPSVRRVSTTPIASSSAHNVLMSDLRSEKLV